MEHLLPVARAVDGRGLVQIHVYAGDRRQIDDGAVAEFLPDVGKDQREGEPFVVAQKDNAFAAQRHDQLVDQAAAAQQLHKDTRQQHPRNEVGQVDHGLHRALEAAGAQLIEQQRKGHRHHHAQHDLPHGQGQGIAQSAAEAGHAKQGPEVLKSYPFGAEHALCGQIFLEGDHNASHRDIVIDKQKQDGQKQHQIQGQIPPELIPALEAALRGDLLLAHENSSQKKVNKRNEAIKIRLFTGKDLENPPSRSRGPETGDR